MAENSHVDAAPGPEAMRQAMADYVRALHQAYLDAVDTLPPAERARLPLVAADRVTVAAVGVRMLHVVATVEALPSPRGPEVQVDDALDDLSWSLRFFDPVVIPELSLLDESATPDYDGVRAALGVRTVVYHLAVPPGGSLTAHHALHAGTGLAHSHASAARDFEALRAHAPGREALVDEMRGASVAGLPRTQVLLARAIAPGLDTLQLDPPTDPADTRRLLLQYLRSP
ncbi:MAG: hypothetical protein B7C55_10420 [Actinomycetales bacterium mxb001]|nr:MAG: hypothetical protein B7C55_10420 [Actinomycetales bacterium mxb001]